MPPPPKLRFSLGANRLAFFQQEVILKTGRQFFRPSRSPNLEAMSVSHRGSRERAKELLRWRGKWLEITVCLCKASCGDPQTGTSTEGGEERLSAAVRSACVSGYQPPHGSPGLVLLMQHADLVTGLPPRHSNMCPSWSCTPGQREGELPR